MEVSSQRNAPTTLSSGTELSIAIRLKKKQAGCGNKEKFMHNGNLTQDFQPVVSYRLWRPLGLREVEAPTVSDIQLIDGSKVVSPTSRPLFTPRIQPVTNRYI
jgi:hypothetical protein